MELKKIHFGFAVMVAALVLSVSAVAEAAGPNLIQNPSFETGGSSTATNWTKGTFGDNNAAFSIATGTANVHEGDRAARITIAEHESGDAKWVFDAVSVTPGQYYTYHHWYKSSVETEVNIFYTTTSGETVVGLGTLSPANEWTLFETSFLVPANVTAVTVAHVLYSTGTLTTDDYSLTLDDAPVFSEGRVTLTFDDGWQSIYDNARPILNTAGIKTTQYIYSDAMNQVHGPIYMTEEELLQMQSEGHDIDAHSRTHANLTTLNDAQKTSEISGSRSDLINAGFSPVDSYAYPHGAYNSDIKQRMIDAGFLGARTVDDGYNYSNTDKYALKIKHVTNQTSAAQVRGWIDTARADKTWLILMFHEIRTPSGSCVGDDSIECSTTTLLQSVVNYLNTTDTCVLTMSQALNDVACGSNPTPTNHTPTVANAIPDQQATEGTAFSYTFPANTFADADNDTLTYSASLSSGNELPVWLSFNGGTRTFSGTPTNADVGTHTITVRAADPDTASTTDTFTITVANSNGAPVISAATFSIAENSAAGTVVGTTTASDSDQGDTLTYEIVSGNTNSAFALNESTGVLSVASSSALDFETTPTFTLVIKVTDSSALSAQATTTITLTDVNENGSNPPTPPAPQPSSGGGGGGGGGVVLGLIGQVTVNPISVPTITTNGVVLGTTTVRFLFTKPLYWGIRGEDVVELHKVLIRDGFLKIPAPTGYFGPLTFAAVKLFQQTHGIDTVGVVGPITRAALNNN